MAIMVMTEKVVHWDTDGCSLMKWNKMKKEEENFKTGWAIGILQALLMDGLKMVNLIKDKLLLIVG